MVTEKSAIATAVENALSTALNARGSMLVEFLCVATTIGPDGKRTAVITTSADQPTFTSLGMVTYLDEWFRDDVRYQIEALARDAEGDE